MTVGQLSFALGREALSDPCKAVQQGVEMLACGCFRRQQFLAGMQSGSQQLQPFAAVNLICSCIHQGLFGLEILQALLPDPRHACCIIQEANWSYYNSRQPLPSILSVGHSIPVSHIDNAGRSSCCQLAVSAVTGLLQQLFSHVLGLESGSSAQQQEQSQDDLHQYSIRLVAELQGTAAHDEVLAISMLSALEACSATTDSAVIARMAQQLLQKSFESSLALPEQPAAALELAWPVAILQHTCWYTSMSVAVNLLGVEQVVQDIQQHMGHAVRTPHALEHICRMLAGVIAAAGGSTDAVLSMLSSTLSVAMKTGQVVDLLAPLLVVQHLLDKSQYSQLLQAGIATTVMGDTSSAGWSALLRFFTLMLYGASQEVLQAHVQLLQQVASAAGQYMQSKVREVLDLLQSAVAEKQQQRRKQQNDEGRTIVKFNASMRSDLQQFQQSPVINGRRQLSEYQRNRWRMYRGTVQDWCTALSHNLPESATDARIRWEFLKALEDLNPGFYNGINLNHVIQSAIKQLCVTCDDAGLDVLGRQEAQPRQPLEQLQHLLTRLPSAAFAANQQLLPVRDLLRQIGQQVENIMQPQAAKEAEAGRPVKRLCIDDRHIAAQVAAVAQYSSHCSSVGSKAQQVVQLLLDTHNSIVLNSTGLSVAWRMEFVDMLHQVKGLHVDLLHQLMMSISGGHGEWRETSARSTAEGRLLALLAAAERGQVLVLQPGSPDALMQADVAVAMYTWQASPADALHSSLIDSGSLSQEGVAAAGVHVQATAATAVAAGKTVGGMCIRHPEILTGFALLDVLMSLTSVDRVREVCHATLFWTAYAAEVGRLGCWTAGAFGPVKTASATSGPVTTAALQQHHKVPMGYLPVQLLGLLKTLRQHLDMAVAEITIHAHDTVSQDFVLQSHKVVTIALKNCEPLRWLQQCVGSGLAAGLAS